MGALCRVQREIGMKPTEFVPAATRRSDSPSVNARSIDPRCRFRFGHLLIAIGDAPDILVREP
jgi:hypothetical protein